MKRYSTRIAAGALIGTLALGAGATPCFAAEPAGTTQSSSLTRLSSTSQRLLLMPSRDVRAKGARQQSTATQESGGFLHSRRGAVALTLMGAGAVFAIWSANHDREPVKSPIR